MSNNFPPDSEATCNLLTQIAQGDAEALELLLDRHRPVVRSYVEARLDRRLRARLDASDIVQEVQMEIVKRMDEFLNSPPLPFHAWVRKMAYWRVINECRNHRHVARRSVDREVAFPEQSSLLLARPLLSQASPSEQVEARELAQRVSDAVTELSEQDREILLMRHAEDLAYEEISMLLEIPSATARKRYGRALLRLRQVLKDAGLLELF